MRLLVVMSKARVNALSNKLTTFLSIRTAGFNCLGSLLFNLSSNKSIILAFSFFITRLTEAFFHFGNSLFLNLYSFNNL